MLYFLLTLVLLVEIFLTTPEPIQLKQIGHLFTWSWRTAIASIVMIMCGTFSVDWDLPKAWWSLDLINCNAYWYAWPIRTSVLFQYLLHTVRSYDILWSKEWNNATLRRVLWEYVQYSRICSHQLCLLLVASLRNQDAFLVADRTSVVLRSSWHCVTKYSRASLLLGCFSYRMHQCYSFQRAPISGTSSFLSCIRAILFAHLVACTTSAII